MTIVFWWASRESLQGFHRRRFLVGVLRVAKWLKKLGGMNPIWNNPNRALYGGKKTNTRYGPIQGGISPMKPHPEWNNPDMVASGGGRGGKLPLRFDEVDQNRAVLGDCVLACGLGVPAGAFGGQLPKPKAQLPKPKAQLPKPRAQLPKPKEQLPKPKAPFPKPWPQNGRPGGLLVFIFGSRFGSRSALMAILGTPGGFLGHWLKPQIGE